MNAELPGTAAFEAASQFVRKDDVVESIPCGPDVEAHVKAVREFVDAGFTDLAVITDRRQHPAGVRCHRRPWADRIARG